MLPYGLLSFTGLGKDGRLTQNRLVPEDICAVRSRLIVTFVGSLMATYEQGL